MSDKNNMRKVIVIAVFVLLMFIAGFIVISATGEQDGTSSDPISSYSTESSMQSSESSENSSQEDPSVSSLSTASQSMQSEPSEPQSSVSKPQSSASKSTQSKLSKPQSAASQSTRSELSKPQSTASQSTQSVPQTETLRFRSKKLLDQHYEKHGKDMGFSSAAEYEKAAAAVPVNPAALHKIEKEDGDDVYYIEATNEFVVVSTDGYIRTYFLPDSGKRYFDKQ